MKYTVTTKFCKLSDRNVDELKKQVRKILRFLPQVGSEVPILRFVLKKHEKHLVYIGSMALALPKRCIIVMLDASSIDEAMQQGFGKLLREIDDYKARHFRNDTEYPDKRSVTYEFES